MACRNEVSPGRSAGLEEDLARHSRTSPHIYTRNLDLKGCVSGVSGWELARTIHEAPAAYVASTPSLRTLMNNAG